MKKLLNIFPSLSMLILSLAGCQEDAELTQLRKITFDAPITSSVGAVELTEDNAGSDEIGRAHV